MEGFKAFADKLAKEISDKKQKYRFCKEHKFEREAQFLQDQISTMEAIKLELEGVAEGLRRPEDVRFYWN